MRPGFKAFLAGLMAAAVALPLAGLHFGAVEQMAASALIALSLEPLLRYFLDQNRKAIWEEKASPIRSNALLALEFSLIFLGVLVAAFAYNGLLPAGNVDAVNPQSAFRDSFSTLLVHNLSVLLVGTFVSIIYRAGGLVMILAWNALHWAQTLTEHIARIGSEHGFVAAASVSTSILPHLAFEVVAYVLGGMAGVFLSIGVLKYKLASSEFSRVSRAAVVLLFSAGGFLALACLLELTLAQFIFHKFS